MSGVDISIDIGQRLGAMLTDFGAQAPQAADIVEDLRFRWQEDLLEVWPVDTGTSLQGWENYRSLLVWVLRNPVEYAEYVHAAGDDVPIVEYLAAKAEEYVADAMPDLERLLAQAVAERAPSGLAALVIPGQTQSTAARLTEAIFTATRVSFARPGLGARERLRERFSDQPIGRALSRRRLRAR